MSDLKINDLMGGHNPHQELLKQTRKLVGKWEPTGLLDDMTDSTKKTGMAVLLENQARQLLNEFSGTGGRSAGTTTAVSYTHLTLPTKRIV